MVNLRQRDQHFSLRVRGLLFFLNARRTLQCTLIQISKISSITCQPFSWVSAYSVLKHCNVDTNNWNLWNTWQTFHFFSIETSRLFITLEWNLSHANVAGSASRRWTSKSQRSCGPSSRSFLHFSSTGWVPDSAVPQHMHDYLQQSGRKRFPGAEETFGCDVGKEDPAVRQV